MTLRRIITIDEAENDSYMLKLECGHESGPVPQRRLPKHRRRCQHCEQITRFKKGSPKVYLTLIRFLRDVPMDDRASAMIDWIDHILRADRYYVVGIEILAAFEMTQQPSSYPLSQWLQRECGPEDSFGFE
ncbi:hypothetical protein [Planctomicrobium sp. SH527]|uniref:hypothetical protein n=1 Tax=Planctomicrobium sp. SH527 TaxID=3448123 RepID=UPI003F5C564C